MWGRDRLWRRGAGRVTTRRLLVWYKQRNFRVFNEELAVGQTYTIFCNRACKQQLLQWMLHPKTKRLGYQLYAEEEARALQLRAPDITPEERLLYAQMKWAVPVSP